MGTFDYPNILPHNILNNGHSTVTILLIGVFRDDIRIVDTNDKLCIHFCMFSNAKMND